MKVMSLQDETLDLCPREDFLRFGFIAETGIALVVAPPGEGKSTFAQQLAFAISTRRPFLGREAWWEQERCLFLAAEGNEKTLQNLIVQRNLAGNPACDLHIIDHRFNLLDKGERTNFISALRDSCNVLIVDTLSRLLPGADENSPAVMTAAVEALEEIRAKVCGGGLVVVVHHTGKDASRGARGHGALTGAVATELILTRKNGDRLSLYVKKNRDGPDGYGIPLRVRTATLPVRDTGVPEGQEGDYVNYTFREIVAAGEVDDGMAADTGTALRGLPRAVWTVLEPKIGRASCRERVCQYV